MNEQIKNIDEVGIETPVEKKEEVQTIEPSTSFEASSDNKKADDFRIIEEDMAKLEDVEDHEYYPDMSGDGPNEEEEMYIYFNEKYGKAFTTETFKDPDQFAVMQLNVQMSIFGELKKIADSLRRTEALHMKKDVS